MDEQTLAAYLERVGAERPGHLDETALAVLHRAHLMTVPFENLSIHLGETISLAESHLIDKNVTRRRGGFCYELNGAFALLLEALGAEVTRDAARVYGDGGLGPPIDHLALVVRQPAGDDRWLADVGFGSHTTHPLRYDSRQEQHDPGGRFALADAADGDVDVFRDGRPEYRIETRGRTLADFMPTCWWQQTSPQSHFTQNTICSRLTEEGRITLSGRSLITTSGGARSEQRLEPDGAVRTANHDHFGISLDQVPAAAMGAS